MNDVNLAPAAADDDVLLQVENLVKYFPVKSTGFFKPRDNVHAVDDVSFTVRRGQTFGIVGETGCGKSTLARCIARLYDITAGQIVFDGQDITKLSQRRMRPLRTEIQMIFQDPIGSLNPRRRVGSIIGDPFAIHGLALGADRKRRVEELMERVGLNPEHYNRFPAEFSGGQRQRIGVARALAFKPKLIICDEPVSALDVSIRSQILNLLRDLQDRLGLAYIFVSHDLAVVKHIADRVAVMNLGGIVETADTQALFASPRHPYSRALLSAIPVPKPQAKRSRLLLQGEMPSALNPPPGCRFHTRCPHAIERCRTEMPHLLSDAAGHATACHRIAELPPADGIAPSDGGFSPALEKLVAAFSGRREGPASSGVGTVGASPPAGV